MSFADEEIIEKSKSLSSVEVATSIEIIFDPDLVNGGDDLIMWEDFLVLQEFSNESSELTS